VAALEVRLNHYSSNSSQPPSTENPFTKREPQGKKEKGQAGAKKGHKGHRLDLTSLIFTLEIKYISGIPSTRMTHFYPISNNGEVGKFMLNLRKKDVPHYLRVTCPLKTDPRVRPESWVEGGQGDEQEALFLRVISRL